jgi:hypothetical protein
VFVVTRIRIDVAEVCDEGGVGGVFDGEDDKNSDVGGSIRRALGKGGPIHAMEMRVVTTRERAGRLRRYALALEAMRLVSSSRSKALL